MRKIKPIKVSPLGDTPAEPQHELAMCVLDRASGHVNIRLSLINTWLIPSGYQSYLFEGKYGLVVIAIHNRSCDSTELVGKILRYVRENLYTNHKLKYLKEVTKND